MCVNNTRMYLVKKTDMDVCLFFFRLWNIPSISSCFFFLTKNNFKNAESNGRRLAPASSPYLAAPSGGTNR